ncbi:D-glycero-beta-D-manno-heptose-7-phosphate kinase [Sphingomonas bacterium]|uniref:D-glycero-beta-D-manno-heptose-7-phosphate kinase n=1 Tax=Sphingomonas bacterium TaxID=1895847 RepID=UPI001574EFA2|nr:D-glycero-beta-D-manno-heptose-7-phosphate kinase [Sphingomonas bacterium]
MDLPDFAAIRVLCIGDVMIDRFVNGRVERISPEGPVPIIRIDDTHSVPGGAANVGRNVSALGGRCTLVGAVGRDAAGAELGSMLSACGRIDPVLVTDDGRLTIEKIRFVASGQTLLRADREEPGEVCGETARALVAAVRDRIADHHVLVLSDYAKGVLTDTVIRGAIDAATDAGVPVVVDPKSAQLSRYAGATVVTPNAREAGIATDIDIDTDEDAARAATRVLAIAGIHSILLTRSERGMTLVTADGAVVHVPTTAREVFDVVGAGDTVVATLALCLGAGLALEPAARIANTAAGIVVGKHGTATASRSELADELVRPDRDPGSPSERKVMSVAGAAALRRQWEREGLTVGFTNGCFDILHVGHVGLLEFARAQCDRLIVGVNADASVTRLKGPSRPVSPEGDRARLLGAFGFVDAVVLFAQDTPRALIEELQPDVLVKGADYAVEDIVGYDIVRKRGGRVVTFDLVPGRSTTGLIARAARPAEVGA